MLVAVTPIRYLNNNIIIELFAPERPSHYNYRFLEHLTNVTVVRGPISLLCVLNFFPLTLLAVAKQLGHQP